MATMRSWRLSAPKLLKKISLHREFADLGVEFLDGGGLVRGLPCAVAEGGLAALLESAAPFLHLAWVDAVARRHGFQGVRFAQCVPSHAGLEVRRKAAPAVA